MESGIQGTLYTYCGTTAHCQALPDYATLHPVYVTFSWSVFADYFVYCGFYFCAIIDVELGDRSLESGGVDCEDFVGGQNKLPLTGDLNQRSHDVYRFSIGT